MKSSNLFKNPIILGTVLLSGAGVSSRFMGFFFRIFLSRTIGAEGLGLYQSVMPIITLSFAATACGYQTAISKFVAQSKETAKGYFLTGIFLSCASALVLSIILYQNSIWIAVNIFGNAKCYSLIQIAAISITPCAFHSCVNGFYYGLKKATLPALSQIIEQMVRIASVYIIYMVLSSQGNALLPAHAMWGITLSEIAGMLFFLSILLIKQPLADFPSPGSLKNYCSLIGPLYAISLPITANHLIQNICSSFENILIPQKLCSYGLSDSDALGIYGILCGVALPVIFFPGVITNSLSVLLLPKISQDNAENNTNELSSTLKKAIRYGLLLGFCFTIIFLLTGRFIGERIFASAYASAFICKLSWLCPFMYTNSLLASILHGLGRPGHVLLINILSSAIRISMIVFLVPKYGVDALLWGMLISQIYTTAAMFYNLKHYSAN